MAKPTILDMTAVTSSATTAARPDIRKLSMEVALKWVNPAYLRAATMQEAQAAFASARPLVHLQGSDFLRPEKAEFLAHLFTEADLDENFSANLHSFSEVLSEKDLKRFNDFKEFVLSDGFHALVGLLTGLDAKPDQFIANRFEPGDYTLLNDGAKLAPGVDCYFDLSARFPDGAGGQVVYLTKKEILIRAPPIFNALTIVPRPTGVMRYVKYVNHRAGSSAVNRVWLSGWKSTR